MRPNIAVAIVAILSGGSAFAQGPVNTTNEATRFDVSVGYQYVKANAPPGAGCPCFGLNGGYASAGLHLNRWLSVEGKYTGEYSKQISSFGQDLTLMTYMAGPKVSYRVGRLVPFGQALFGGAHGSNSYFPTTTGFTTTATSFAYALGGGFDVNITPRFAVRAIQADFLRTGFPNGTSDNSQRQLMIGAGLVVKFRGRRRSEDGPPPAPAPLPNHVTDLSCSTRNVNVKVGQLVDVTGKATTTNSKGDVAYSWTTSGGVIQGTGRRVTVNTAGLAEGDYVVTGHASLTDDAQNTSECEVSFHVTEEPKPVVIEVPQPPPPPPPPSTPSEVQFHENVPDVFFDYDKWNIRPDGAAAIAKAAEYLNSHPKLRVVVGGFSDERGTTEYNIALGLKRANATRDALIAAGVSADRLQVISYGKGAQVCTAENEACWQQNRRAAFNIRP